jgi:hypothetical protein
VTTAVASSARSPHDPRVLAAGIDREVIALAKHMPELKQRLSQIAEQALTQAKQAPDDRKAKIQAFDQLKKDLASLSPE